MSLVTLTQAKAYLQITGTDQDTFVTALIVHASNVIRGLADATLEPLAQETAKVDGGALTLRLPKYPARAVTSVTDLIEEEEVEVEDYFIESAPAFVRQEDETKWLPGVLRYEVEYTPGPAAVPGDVQAATLMVIAALFSSSDQSLSSEKIGDYAYTRAAQGAVSQPVLDIMERYRKPGF